MSNCIRHVATVIGGLSEDVVKMPSGNNVALVMEQFQAIANMPGCIGALDCTHIAIRRTSCENPELYRITVKVISH